MIRKRQLPARRVLHRLQKAPAVVAPERRIGAPQKRKDWRTTGRSALSEAAKIRASVLDFRLRQTPARRDGGPPLR
jgi:hypothetical protein